MRQRFVAMIIGVLIGGAAAIGSAAVVNRTTNAHVDPPSGHTGTYSYSGSNCAGKADPVQVVYFDNATSSTVASHSAAHGNWDEDDGGNSDDLPFYQQQYFRDHGCSPKDDEAATEGFESTRYHQRWEEVNGNNLDPFFGRYSIATPHFEDIVRACAQVVPPIPAKHAVRENLTTSEPTDRGEGGFIHAKHEIVHRWTYNWPGTDTHGPGIGPHKWHGTQDWDNGDVMVQCDQGRAWGNGIVDFIRANHVVDP
jgi:hypothetical protein